MSLDIWFKQKTIGEPTSGIFIRENGQIKEITPEEWEKRNPGVPPHISIMATNSERYVFDANITHNLNKMAAEAGIYGIVWRPEENNITHAKQLVEPLTVALVNLKARPEHYKQFNASNGWGKYDNFVEFVTILRDAAIQYPDSEIGVSR